MAVTLDVLLDDTVLAASEPCKSFKSERSPDTELSAVSIELSAVIWDWMVVCSVCHWRSGARAAYTAASTALVTSMPTEVAPVAAASRELMSTEDALDVALELEESSELMADEELMMKQVSYVRAPVYMPGLGQNFRFCPILVLLLEKLEDSLLGLVCLL